MSSISHVAAHPAIHQHKRTDTQHKQHEKQDIVAIIGRIASVLSVLMYVSYITQIANNLDGNPGSPWQPLCAFFNCTMWTIYGFMKPKRDIPIIVANIPGIVLGLVTFITAIVH
ncbi:SemiSWEET family transporter [Adlercreutzia sp. R7]|uniref:SemiSWEET family transporter n=1 Tax=Adlercreutzia wanghongyangiae TaxID=3111451 RepID=A0ABU6IF02_9ACTN|nr:SemiSWEET family transporter [Adlercreutzia sp. R7]